MHSALVVFHRWLGLTASLFIFVIAGTGSALVFESNIDHAMNPQLWHTSGLGASLSLDSLAARAESAVKIGHVTGMSVPADSDSPVIATAGTRQVFLDPRGGKLLGVRDAAIYNRSLSRRLHRLHVQLLEPNGGSTVVALMTIASLLLTITGLIVWWRDKRWQINWRASWKRIVFDLHHSLGLFASLILLVVTTSGIAIHYDSITSLLVSMDGQPEIIAPRQGPPVIETHVIGFDSALRVAEGSLPEARVTGISIPEKGDQPIRVSMRFDEDRTPAGRSRVYVDRFRGVVIGMVSTRAVGAGTRLSNSMRSIHTGDIFGAPTRALWFIAALILASQAVSGALMWWNARRGR